MVWRLLSVLEVGLRLGTGAGLVERVLRQAIDEAPGLDVYRPWLAAEFNRGLARELADAGRALSGYDAQPWAHQLRLPAVSLITTTDRLVRPSKQRELAEALHAHVVRPRLPRRTHAAPVSRDCWPPTGDAMRDGGRLDVINTQPLAALQPARPVADTGVISLRR